MVLIKSILMLCMQQKNQPELKAKENKKLKIFDFVIFQSLILYDYSQSISMNFQLCH
jgi:hypothetical protein